jgi:TolB-like protein/Tfp pilus assembly protein PilF
LRFLAELKRRNVIRMAGLYLVGAWLVVQVAATLLPVFEAPAWLMKVLVIVLAFGFFAALVVSWIYELTPAGLQRDDQLDSAHAPYPGAERRLRRISDAPAVPPAGSQRVHYRQRLQDRLIIVLLLFAVGYFLLDKFVLDAPLQEQSTTAGVPPGAGAAAPTAPPQAASDLIAVLPFRNRSALPEDAYFAEGMHDDLLTQLSKVAGFKVISRTSMMRYADTKLSVPEIARELGAAVILEGAVQRSGDQVLVTVQLIQASTDVHLWAERYDRALTTDTVFAIQAEIAQAVADATRVVLSPAETKALATGSTDNMLAYEAFLQGKLLAANDLATPERFAAALVQFERAIKLDPTFAEAHARKARIQLASYWFGYADASMREAAKRTTAQAVALAPDDIETWMAQAYFHYWGELDYASADALLKRVIERAPGHAEAWYARGLVGRRDGRYEDTIAAFRESLKIDPANTDTLLELSNTLLTLGEYEESDALRRDRIQPRRYRRRVGRDRRPQRLLCGAAVPHRIGQSQPGLDRPGAVHRAMARTPAAVSDSSGNPRTGRGRGPAGAGPTRRGAGQAAEHQGAHGCAGDTVSGRMVLYQLLLLLPLRPAGHARRPRGRARRRTRLDRKRAARCLGRERDSSGIRCRLRARRRCRARP